MPATSEAVRARATVDHSGESSSRERHRSVSRVTVPREPSRAASGGCRTLVVPRVCAAIASRRLAHGRYIQHGFHGCICTHYDTARADRPPPARRSARRSRRRRARRAARPRRAASARRNRGRAPPRSSRRAGSRSRSSSEPRGRPINPPKHTPRHGDGGGDGEVRSGRARATTRRRPRALGCVLRESAPKRRRYAHLPARPPPAHRRAKKRVVAPDSPPAPLRAPPTPRLANEHGDDSHHGERAE